MRVSSRCPWLPPLAACLCLLAHTSAHGQAAGPVTNQASYTYQDPSGTIMGGLTGQTILVDPRGVVTGGDGSALPDYTGFTIGVYRPAAGDPTGTEVGPALTMTPTIPTSGAAPNTGNGNPFPLSNTDGGTFVFQLDPAQGQVTPGQTYILLVLPPAGSGYHPRRVRLTIGAQSGTQIAYTVTSLDGEPVGVPGGQDTFPGTALLPPGPGALAAFGFRISVFRDGGVQITKTGDQAAAQPGDTVIYRVTVSNTSDQALTAVRVTDTLPLGFDFRASSVRGMVQGQSVSLSTVRSGPSVTFTLGGAGLPAGQTLTIAYAALLTPDALNGNGRNSAVVSAQSGTSVNGQATTRTIGDGPATYTVLVQQGLLSDTGTILGRVFVDRNFDGEQEAGEPGVAGAVVLLDDSTRIVADANGLFNVPTVNAGWHTATLDLRGMPDYALARNHRFLERNSQSRLVRLEPGGLARFNFAVTPRDTEKSHP